MAADEQERPPSDERERHPDDDGDGAPSTAHGGPDPRPARDDRPRGEDPPRGDQPPPLPDAPPAVPAAAPAATENAAPGARTPDDLIPGDRLPDDEIPDDEIPDDEIPDDERSRRGPRWLRWTAVGAAVLVLGASGAGYLTFRTLDGNITSDANTAEELQRHDADRPARGPGAARTVLIIGSDDPSSLPGAVGGIGARSDTVILLHLSGDRDRATALSIPRDLMVDVPACTGEDGETTPARRAQFNWAYSFGGASCTIRTVEQLTGIRLDHHLDIDFAGFKELVDAVGGIEVDLPEAVRDHHTELDLEAGRQVLHGDDALAYVRARKGIGDGSDTARIARQQQFLGLLAAKLRSSEVLMNPGRLYPVLSTATSAITVDPGLSSLPRLYELVSEVRDVPDDALRFLTVPRVNDPDDPDRDVLVQPDADELFKQLRWDQPVTLGSSGAAAPGGVLAPEGAENRPPAGQGTP
ncbi:MULTISPECIES: LCP family protein [unclassified Streptomyces]|uniref:LCP family protein n=1 Tax=unclassified Streptomyces TaxID=2593676 RepID=UPI000CD509F4|nr:MULTISPECIES: LCP family protein [unclassified Streptomyces]